MPVAGEGRRKILVCGEAPGAEEDSQGRPFVGPSGQYLQGHLAAAGIDLFRDCWVTNSAICRPPHNALPEKAVFHCRPNVVNAIKELGPETIILLGAGAVQSVVGWLWKEDVGPVGRWVKWKVPARKVNAWVCPTWHPSFLLRSQGKREYALLERMFRDHLRTAGECSGRPWPEPVPDPLRQVRCLYDPEEAASEIRRLAGGSRLTAFDYEASTLKPDGPEAGIVCCSLSDGETTIAFPWVGEAVRAMKEFLRSEVPKCGANVKYEQRYSMAVLGLRVRNWVWDTMLAAHVLDNRPGITGLKFQAFARLGVGPYDEQVAPYLKAANSNARNRVCQVAMDKLLAYCGADSLLEWELARLQMEEMGFRL
jgi:uracil-DNA glycosylase family 4